jgi:hypothetical protein
MSAIAEVATQLLDPSDCAPSPSGGDRSRHDRDWSPPMDKRRSVKRPPEKHSLQTNLQSFIPMPTIIATDLVPPLTQVSGGNATP